MTRPCYGDRTTPGQTGPHPDPVDQAWDAFFEAKRLAEGSPTGNLIDDMRLAFEAGMRAASQ